MSQRARYAGRSVALPTQHGRERVIKPVLQSGLDCSILDPADDLFPKAFNQ